MSDIITTLAQGFDEIIYILSSDLELLSTLDLKADIIGHIGENFNVIHKEYMTSTADDKSGTSSASRVFLVWYDSNLHEFTNTVPKITYHTNKETASKSENDTLVAISIGKGKLSYLSIDEDKVAHARGYIEDYAIEGLGRFPHIAGGAASYIAGGSHKPSDLDIFSFVPDITSAFYIVDPEDEREIYERFEQISYTEKTLSFKERNGYLNYIFVTSDETSEEDAILENLQSFDIVEHRIAISESAIYDLRKSNLLEFGYIDTRISRLKKIIARGYYLEPIQLGILKYSQDYNIGEGEFRIFPAHGYDKWPDIPTPFATFLDRSGENSYISEDGSYFQTFSQFLASV